MIHILRTVHINGIIQYVIHETDFFPLAQGVQGSSCGSMYQYFIVAEYLCVQLYHTVYHQLMDTQVVPTFQLL